MTNQSGTSEIDNYVKEWASMMINIWQEKMLFLNLQNADSDSLFQSLQQHIITSGMGTAVITHFFNFYGIYVDKGTGKEIAKGNSGDLGFTPERQPKPWFNKKFYYYTRKLAERIAEINQQDAAYIIKNVIEGK